MQCLYPSWKCRQTGLLQMTQEILRLCTCTYLHLLLSALLHVFAFPGFWSGRNLLKENGNLLTSFSSLSFNPRMSIRCRGKHGAAPHLRSPQTQWFLDKVDKQWFSELPYLLLAQHLRTPARCTMWHLNVASYFPTLASSSPISGRRVSAGLCSSGWNHPTEQLADVLCYCSCPRYAAGRSKPIYRYCKKIDDPMTPPGHVLECSPTTNTISSRICDVPLPQQLKIWFRRHSSVQPFHSCSRCLTTWDSVHLWSPVFSWAMWAMDCDMAWMMTRRSRVGLVAETPSAPVQLRKYGFVQKWSVYWPEYPKGAIFMGMLNSPSTVYIEVATAWHATDF